VNGLFRPKRANQSGLSGGTAGFFHHEVTKLTKNAKNAIEERGKPGNFKAGFVSFVTLW
jgi:hypothetical protein